MFRICQMRNGGTFERIYRFLQSFLRFSVWPPMHSEPVFDSKPEECLSFGFSFLSFTLLICTELGMPACLSPHFFNSLSLSVFLSFFLSLAALCSSQQSLCLIIFQLRCVFFCLHLHFPVCQAITSYFLLFFTIKVPVFAHFHKLAF